MNDVVGPDPIARIPSIHRMYAITVGKITTYARTIQKRPVSCPQGTAESFVEEDQQQDEATEEDRPRGRGHRAVRTDRGRDRMEVAAQHMRLRRAPRPPTPGPPARGVEETSPKKRAAPPAKRRARDPPEADPLAEESMPAIAVKTGDMVGMIIPASEAGARTGAEEEGVEPVTPTRETKGQAPPVGTRWDRFRRPAEEDRHHQQGAEAETGEPPHLGRTSSTSIFDVAKALPQKTIVRTSPA